MKTNVSKKQAIAKQSKKCAKWGLYKDLCEFHKNKRTKDGGNPNG